MTVPKKLTEQNFAEATQSGISLIDFYADWCPPCKALSPTIDAFAKKHQAHFVVGKVDIDENSALAAQYNVRSIPTVIIFKDGKEVERVSGNVPLAQLEGLTQNASL